MTGVYGAGACVKYVKLSEADKKKDYPFPPTDPSVGALPLRRVYCPRCAKSIAIGRICDRKASFSCSACRADRSAKACSLIPACYYQHINTLVELRRLYERACDAHLAGCYTDTEREAAFKGSKDCMRIGRELAMAQLTFNRLIAKSETEARVRSSGGNINAIEIDDSSTTTFSSRETTSPEMPSLHGTVSLTSRDTPDHVADKCVSAFNDRRLAAQRTNDQPPSEQPAPHQPIRQKATPQQPPEQPSVARSSAPRLSTVQRITRQRFDPLGESAQRKGKEREGQTPHTHDDSIMVASSSAGPASSTLNGATEEQVNGKRPRSDSMNEVSATEVRATSRASEIKRLKMRLEEISIERRLMELAEEV